MFLNQIPKATSYLISQAAQLSGVTSANIRFYEKENLIAARGKSENGYRFYSEEDVHQLRFIRQLRSLDMTLDEVRTLLHLDLSNKRDCQTAQLTLDTHIGHVRKRLKELRGLEKSLVALRSECDGHGEHCKIIEALHAQADSMATSNASHKKYQAL
jgi:DNA-binding transcriptional MerR regulator